MPYYQKKPVIIEALQFEDSDASVTRVYTFIHGNVPDSHSCQMAEDRWFDFCDNARRNGLELKTKESGEGVQIATVGDYIVKGFTEELGWHFWPVKPSYFEENYFEVPEPEAL